MAPRIQGHRPAPLAFSLAGAIPTAPPRPTARIGLAPLPPLSNEAPTGVGRGRRATSALGTLNGQALRLGPGGQLLVGGRAPATNQRALAIYDLARGVAAGTLNLAHLPPAKRQGLFETVQEVLQSSLQRRPSALAEKGYSGALALLLGLAEHAPKAEAELKAQALEQALIGLERTPNHEQAAFYLLSVRALSGGLSRAQKQRLQAVTERVMPKGPLVEEYTDDRRRPLEVRHTIHPEFWKEELRYFSKKHGFTLLKQNAQDTRREYRGELKDPNGLRPPLHVHLIVNKNELDYLEPISDPKVHVILYSGHSSLGGNGSQAIQAAGAMEGAHPKLIMAANCRGKDNYAELSNKWPTAHLISTEHPTYGPAGQARVKALFETLAKGESYAHMRQLSQKRYWDEPANNYFYPDELRKYRFMDADEDGKFDLGRLGVDRVFDVDAKVSAGKFHRAINFANSELFYHWEVEHEEGRQSQYGKVYADAFSAAGPLPDPQATELIRVTEVPGPGPQKNFAVQYNVAQVAGAEQNVLAGHLTAHAVMALARDQDGELTRREALRAALMGAQAVHYLDVYADTSAKNLRRYFSQIGLTKRMEEPDMEHLFEKFDSHANDAQLDAFAKLLTEKYGVKLDAWVPQFAGAPAIV